MKTASKPGLICHCDSLSGKCPKNFEFKKGIYDKPTNNQTNKKKPDRQTERQTNKQKTQTVNYNEQNVLFSSKL